MENRKANQLALHRAPRSSLLALLLALSVGLQSAASSAQEPGSKGELDSNLPSDGSLEQRPSGLDMMYGGVTIAGQGRAGSEEAHFGLDRMYGGVSGAAGVHGDRIGRPRRNLPQYHVVKKGDTLWDLSAHYYGSPWAWPQVWSLNPQIENPHWIYPGDQLRTARQPQMEDTSPSEDNSASGNGFVGRARTVPNGTVFVRDQGYLGDPERDVWGEVSGSHQDQMMLSDGNTIYIKVKDGVDLRLGQRLTVFDDIAEAPDVEDARKPPGEIVKIYGTVRVDGWDQENRIARGALIESIDVIERGFRVGPVGRRFDVVPPRPATEDVEARILTGVYPHVYFGQNQLVFIDKGSDDGLVSGNRLRALRRGDTWSRNIERSNHFLRVRVDMGSPEMPEKEVAPVDEDEEKYPDEVVGELIVLRTEEYSSICLITGSVSGLQAGERVVAVKGY